MSQEEGLSTGRFDSDRRDLSCDTVPKVESPGGGQGSSITELEPQGITCETARAPGQGSSTTELEPLGITCGTARAPYLPARSPAWDLAGVERWVGRLAVDLGPGVPCERYMPETWVFLQPRSPPDDDRDN